jgi:hypothetical protein
VTTAATKGNLHTALLAFQAEAPTLPKDATNPHFRSKFTSLEAIVERIGPLLAKNGLTWATLPTVLPESGMPALRYRLTHAASGEYIEDTMPLLVTKADPQGQGSAITYARRYSICAVLNLVADEDDDGNSASRSNGRAIEERAVQALGATPVQPMTPAARAKVVKAFADAGVDDMGLFLTAVGLEDADLMTVEHALRLRELLDAHLAKATA